MRSSTEIVHECKSSLMFFDENIIQQESFSLVTT